MSPHNTLSSRRQRHRPRRSTTLSTLLNASSSFDILSSSCISEAKSMVPDAPAFVPSSRKTSRQRQYWVSKKSPAQKPERSKEKIPFYLQPHDPPREPVLDPSSPINSVHGLHQEKLWDGGGTGDVYLESDIMSYRSRINSDGGKNEAKKQGGYERGTTWFFKPKPKRQDEPFAEESGYYTRSTAVDANFSNSNEHRRQSASSDSSASPLRRAAQTGMSSARRILWPWYSPASPREDGSSTCVHVQGNSEPESRKYEENLHPLPRETATWQGKKKGYGVWHEGDGLMRMGRDDDGDIAIGRELM